jgi:hypothetical protein
MCLCARSGRGPKSVDLVDLVDPFSAVPLGSVGMNSSLTISTH